MSAEQELINVSEALDYEIKMLIASVNGLGEIVNDPDDKLPRSLKNAWFECFLLHARQLAYFLNDEEPINISIDGKGIQNINGEPIRPTDYQPACRLSCRRHAGIDTTDAGHMSRMNVFLNPL